MMDLGPFSMVAPLCCLGDFGDASLGVQKMLQKGKWKQGRKEGRDRHTYLIHDQHMHLLHIEREAKTAARARAAELAAAEHPGALSRLFPVLYFYPKQIFHAARWAGSEQGVGWEEGGMSDTSFSDRRPPPRLRL